MKRFALALILTFASAASAVTTCTFAGTLTTAWETAGNWDVAPGAGDTCIINATCLANTDLSGTVYGTITINAGKTLTLGATGKIYNADADITVPASGLVMVAGSTLRLTRTSGTRVINITGANGVTGTGTIELSSATDSANVRMFTAGAGIVGTSIAAPILIDGGVGAAKVSGVIGFGNSALLQNVEVTRCSNGLSVTGYNIGARVVTCKIHDCTGNGIYAVDDQRFSVEGCYIYSNPWGLSSGYAMVECVGCVFGQDEASASKPNTTTDVRTIYNSVVRLSNCLLASSAEVAAVAGYMTDPAVISTSHDQVRGSFKVWQAGGHVIETEGTAIHTAGGKAVKFTSASTTTAAYGYRLRSPIALQPAAHGDTLDVKVWLRGTAKGKTVNVTVDPDGIYGTTKTVACKLAAADTYEQATVPTYTVATSAGTKSVIPIVIQIEEASTTSYADDLTISVNGGAAKLQTFDFGWNDVFPIESIGAGGGLMRQNTQTGGMR